MKAHKLKKRLQKASRETGRVLVEVRWVDSAGVDGWCPPDAAPTTSLEVLTVGFVISHTNDSIVVAGTIADPAGQSEQVNSPLTIPLLAVRKVTIWA